MCTDHYGPQGVQCEHTYKHLDLESDNSDPHSKLEQPSETGESPVPKKSTKLQHKAPLEPELSQPSTDPVFYRKVDMSDQNMLRKWKLLGKF